MLVEIKVNFQQPIGSFRRLFFCLAEQPVHDLIEDGVNGHLVTYGDINSFACKVEALMLDEPRRMAYAAQGFNVASRFSNKEIVERWIRLLNRE